MQQCEQCKKRTKVLYNTGRGLVCNKCEGRDRTDALASNAWGHPQDEHRPMTGRVMSANFMVGGVR